MKLSENEFAKILQKNPALKEKVDRQTFTQSKREVKEYIPVVSDEKALLEDAIQSAFFEWIDNESNQILMPELKLIYAIPNGSHKTKFQRYLFAVTGLKSGVPDIHIAVSRKPFFSMYIEFKTWKRFNTKEKGCSAEQIEWHQRLKAQGHRVDIIWSVSDAIRLTKEYLGYE